MLTWKELIDKLSALPPERLKDCAAVLFVDKEEILSVNCFSVVTGPTDSPEESRAYLEV